LALRNILFITVLFILVLLALFVGFQHRRTIAQTDREKIDTFRGEYQALIEGYRVVSDTLFENVIAEQTEIAEIMHRAVNANSSEEKEALRDRLFTLLGPFYSNLRQYNFRQLHFHLDDLTSFARFHRPEKWGDDLTGIRATVEEVKRTGQAVRGFEEGRIFNGYRHVFPVSYDGAYVGSVEISISMKAIIESLTELYDRPVQFLLSTEVMQSKVFDSEQQQYTFWDLSDRYVLDPECTDMVLSADKLTESEKRKILSYLNPQLNEPLSLHSGRLENLIFLPVKNIEGRPVAVLITRMDDHTYRAGLMSYILTLVLIVFLILLIIYLAFRTQRSHDRLDRMATYDGLTGSFSRTGFLKKVDDDLKRFHRYANAISLIYFDLDHFKQINDTHGHSAGDCVLRVFSTVVQSRLRETDYFGRVGGDEFIAALPGTDRTGAEELACMIQKGLKSTRMCDIGTIHCSIGVGEARKNYTSVEDFVAAIDQAMYQSKRGGRNRITVLP